MTQPLHEIADIVCDHGAGRRTANRGHSLRARDTRSEPDVDSEIAEANEGRVS